MRILAISDIHNNVACVRKLRAQEDNDFDVVTIAGDIGDRRAVEIFEVLRTFKCPIVYVYGNWDQRLRRTLSFDKKCYLLHLNFVKIGSVTFTGFSFPSSGAKLTYAQYSERCQRAIAKRLAVAGIDLSRTIFITHERASYLARRFPDLLLHLFGHAHTFDVFRRGATTYVNPSALDRIRGVVPKSLASKPLHPMYLRHANVGNYAVIELGSAGEVSVECRLLCRTHQNWAMTDREWMNGVHGGALIPEDTVFGDNVRFPRTSQGR